MAFFIRLDPGYLALRFISYYSNYNKQNSLAAQLIKTNFLEMIFMYIRVYDYYFDSELS